MVELVPMTEEEFLSFVREDVPAYAEEKVASGEWVQDRALTLAQDAFNHLLPQGLGTPNHFLFMIRDPSEGVPVGRLWIAAQARGSERVAYVYSVSVKPEYQRRGYATRAFHALEERVRVLGLSGIALHAFGHNTAALALYTKLGYQTTDVNMFKAIGKAAT